MDKTTVLGLVVGVLAILLGNALEGGHLNSLMQGTAALIVFGGTIGAVLVGTPKRDFHLGLKLAKMAFREQDPNYAENMVETVVGFARDMRKESILAIEKNLSSVKDDFLKESLRLLVDGVESPTIQEVGEARIDQEESRLNRGAKIWADAGGYAPTIGILGAVLGLIHVMGNLTDTSKLGAGIAVAFVATIYGVALANLVFLPIGSKIKAKIKEVVGYHEMVLEGVLGLANGMNPVVIEQKMRAYLPRELKDVSSKK